MNESSLIFDGSLESANLVAAVFFPRVMIVVDFNGAYAGQIVLSINHGEAAINPGDLIRTTVSGTFIIERSGDGPRMNLVTK